MASERFAGLSAVLESVRRAPGITQADVADRVGLGRSVVAERVAELEAVGLISTVGRAPSRGGRAPRSLTLNPGAGYVIGVDVATSELIVGAANLAGEMVGERLREHIDVAKGPDEILARIEHLVTSAIAERQAEWGRPLAVGVGLPGPVDVDEGVPVDVPVLVGWARYPVQAELRRRLGLPVWVDDRNNLLALAELVASSTASGVRELLYVGAGSNTGAALVIDGSLYRGSHGLAGSIGHIAVPGAGMIVCRCGRFGCLEAVSGGWAIERDGLLLATSGRSPHLAAVLERTSEIRAYDVTLGATAGDDACIELLGRSATLLGESLASLVSLFAPQMLVVGGGIARAGAFALEPIRTVLRAQLPPRVTEELIIELSVLDEQVGGVLGAARLVVDALLGRSHLPGVLTELSTSRANLAAAPAS